MLSIEQKREALRRCPLFSQLEVTEIGVLSESMEEELFHVGEEVCLAGETADRVYIIYEGALAVYLPNLPEPVRVLRPSQVFGEYGMVTQTRTTTIKAVETTTMLSMSYERFQNFLLSYPAALFELFRTSVNRLIGAEKRLIEKNHQKN